LTLKSSILTSLV